MNFSWEGLADAVGEARRGSLPSVVGDTLANTASNLQAGVGEFAQAASSRLARITVDGHLAAVTAAESIAIDEEALDALAAVPPELADVVREATLAALFAPYSEWRKIYGGLVLLDLSITRTHIVPLDDEVLTRLRMLSQCRYEDEQRVERIMQSKAKEVLAHRDGDKKKFLAAPSPNGAPASRMRGTSGFSASMSEASDCEERDVLLRPSAVSESPSMGPSSPRSLEATTARTSEETLPALEHAIDEESPLQPSAPMRMTSGSSPLTAADLGFVKPSPQSASPRGLVSPQIVGAVDVSQARSRGRSPKDDPPEKKTAGSVVLEYSRSTAGGAEPGHGSFASLKRFCLARLCPCFRHGYSPLATDADGAQ